MGKNKGKIILNSALPICTSCDNYEELEGQDGCNAVNIKNLVNGAMNIVDCVSCRKRPDLCSEEGKFFEPKKKEVESKRKKAGLV